MTGDGFTDLVATRSDGSLWLFSNNFLRDGGWPYSDVRQIGQGWQNYNRIIADPPCTVSIAVADSAATMTGSLVVGEGILCRFEQLLSVYRM